LFAANGERLLERGGWVAERIVGGKGRSKKQSRTRRLIGP